MPVRTTIQGSEDTLFITFICYRWLPLIEITNNYSLVYKWFDCTKQIRRDHGKNTRSMSESRRGKKKNFGVLNIENGDYEWFTKCKQ